MPKGQKRTANQQLADVQAEIDALVAKKLDLQPKAKSENLKHHQRRAFIIGEALLTLKATMTADEARTVWGILKRLDPKPKDWNKVSDFEADDPESEPEYLGDFRSRTDGEGLDEVSSAAG